MAVQFLAIFDIEKSLNENAPIRNGCKTKCNRQAKSYPGSRRARGYGEIYYLYQPVVLT